MAGFGIIDPFCTDKAYCDLNIRRWPRPLMTLSAIRVYRVAITTTFMLGYEIGVSGGLIIQESFLTAFFPTLVSDPMNPFSKFSHSDLSIFVSSFYMAVLAAWLIAPWLNKILGMRKSMILASTLLVCGVSLSCFGRLVARRFLVGFGIGLSIHFMTIYVSEIARLKQRFLLFAFQFVVGAGIVAANWANWLGWRIGLGGAILPALIALVFSAYLPEISRKVGGDDESKPKPWRLLFLKKNRHHLVTSTLLPFLQQLTGMNVLVLFAPVILSTMGRTTDDVIQTIIGDPGIWLLAWSFCGNLFPMLPIRISHHRNALLIFGLLLAILNIEVADTMGWLSYGKLTRSLECCFTTSHMWKLLLFIHFGSAGWDHISWTMLNETLPQEIRLVAWRLSMSVVLICYALVAHFGLPLLAFLHLGIFAIMSCWVILGMLIFYSLLPDEKPFAYPTVERVFLWENHSFWKGYVLDAGT